MGYQPQRTSRTSPGAAGIDIESWRRRIRAGTFANYHYEMGVATRAAGELAAAADHFRHAVENQPDMAQAHFRRIQTLHELGRADDASQAERDAAAACPDYAVEARYRIAYAHFAAGRHGAAEAALRSALEIAPDHGPTRLLLLAAVALQRKRADTAALLAEMKSDLPPLSAAAALDLFDVGQALLRAGQWPSAELVLAAVEGAAPEFPEARIYHGLSMIGCGSVAEGFSMLRAVALRDLTTVSSLPRDLADMAQQSAVEGRWAESVELLRLAAALQPDDARVLEGLGYALMLSRRWPGALLAVDRSLLVKPRVGQNHALRGRILQAMGRFEEGVAETRRGADLDPSLPTRYAHVVALQNAGRLDDAEALAERCHAEDTLRSRSCLYLSHAKLAKRDLAGAERIARDGLAQEPASARLAANLGLILHAGGKTAEAVAAYRSALQSDQSDNWVQSTAGLAAYLEGKPDEAVAIQEHAISMFAFSAWTQVNAGLVLHAAGHSAKAQAAFERAVEAEPHMIGFQIRLRPWAEPFLREVFGTLGVRSIG